MLTRICLRISTNQSSAHWSQPFQIGLRQPFTGGYTELMSPFNRKCSFKNIFIMGYPYLGSEARQVPSVVETAPSSLSVFPCINVLQSLSSCPVSQEWSPHILKDFAQGSNISYGNVISFSFINQAAMTRAVKFYLVA